jgi:hypothetical protein
LRADLGKARSCRITPIGAGGVAITKISHRIGVLSDSRGKNDYEYVV